MGHVSIAVFAKQIGTASRSTIYRAIETGKLVQHVKKVKGKWVITDVAGALAEWAESYPAEDGRTNASLRAKIKKVSDSSEGTQQPAVDQPADEKPIPKKAVSDAKLAALKAEMAEMELMEKLGTLVKRELIDKALHAAGQEIREAFLALPDRITDDLMAVADNRTAFHSLLTSTICAVLENLSDPTRVLEMKLGK